MRRRLDPETRKKEILKSAAEAFATQPYETVRIDAIARDSGASRALINHYFGDKRGLFLAVARDLLSYVPEQVRSDLELEPTAMVRANTRAWMDMLEENRRLALLFLDVEVGSMALDPELRGIKDELRDLVTERILRNHLGDGEIPPPARHTMRAATGMMERVMRDWLTEGGPGRREAEAIVVESVLALVRQVIPAVIAVDGAADPVEGSPGDHDPLGEHPRTP